MNMDMTVMSLNKTNPMGTLRAPGHLRGRSDTTDAKQVSDPYANANILSTEEGEEQLDTLDSLMMKKFEKNKKAQQPQNDYSAYSSYG